MRARPGPKSLIRPPVALASPEQHRLTTQLLPQDAHTCGSRNEGEAGAAGVPERPVRELLTHLKAHHEEEDDHHAIVDPVVEIHVCSEGTDVEADVGMPQPEVGLGQRRVGPQQGDKSNGGKKGRRPRLRAQPATRPPMPGPGHPPWACAAATDQGWSCRGRDRPRTRRSAGSCAHGGGHR